ncbi:Quercetin 2,3-dioxygenase [Pseudovibrio axinellae]|uniref:Quercetin 2,3-dioxygenase n=1 Tax=Pseudovibrio axinellae TaxID=989403 RepID=A0A161X7P2_9HYPH|nr:pirin family protein [Pseudovibrio axinellae]KZL05013.1 Quercetin 2,3-dioxygenase [Pseudovibrio axinellae]SER64786.1 hypothetical protein SAMN05421798_11517 [Pseudovibrio axinellae]
MQTKRYRDDRGPTDAGWLKSMHTFSFGQYYDPDHMGFGVLRVINDDRVIPGAGFGKHPHKNMEIISYVIEGALAHKDSMGNASTITPGEVQVMSAGSGVTHSEYNGLDDKQVHFLQIWIEPNQHDTAPGYQQKRFDPALTTNRFGVVVSNDGRGDSLFIKQDAQVFVGKFDEAHRTEFVTQAGRKYWVQIADGHARINGESAKNGDGFAIENESSIILEAETQVNVLLFDVPQ